jgi:2-succinyl-6-hydroxy-2,4-cyclohexadiene-1-carboxylate synthase
VISQFHYSFHGNSNHPVVLFLHGFLGNREDFDEVIPLLVDRYSCLTLDLPGHGKTDVVDDYSMPKTADEIVALLDNLKIPQAFLVGYSMGGRLALYLALNFPERFPKVVIESGSPGLKTEEERSTRLQRDFALADQLETNFSQFLTDWYEQPLFQSLKQHPKFEQLLDQRLQNDPIGLAKSLREMSTGAQPSLWEKLKAHQNSLLLIVGERDRKFININQEMVSICETARLAIVPDVGHNIHLEKPEIFANYIKDFLLS